MDTFATTIDNGGAGRRSAILAVIVVFHVLLIWALNSSLRQIVTERVFGPVKTEIIEEVQDEEQEPPPPPPKIETPPPFVPPPDIIVDAPVDTGPTTAISQVTRERPAAPPPVAAPSVKKAPVIDPRYKRRFQPDYPPTSRRLGEEGSVVLQVYVDAEGKVTEAKVQTSSGFSRLDEAALNHAKRAWRFTPASEDGKPVATWHSVKVTFKIEG